MDGNSDVTSIKRNRFVTSIIVESNTVSNRICIHSCRVIYVTSVQFSFDYTRVYLSQANCIIIIGTIVFD